MKIGEYTYSYDTYRRFRNNYYRGIESMISERINISYGDILICSDNGRYMVIIKSWTKKYKTEDFNKGRETFVEQVILDYTFGVTD
jgi:hypothetical protein